MHITLVRFCRALWRFAVRQDGQDLVEYALIIALMTLAATAGLRTPAQAIYQAFNNSASTFETVTGFNQ
jgi:Flp pilus assembly pilin Flp